MSLIYVVEPSIMVREYESRDNSRPKSIPIQPSSHNTPPTSDTRSFRKGHGSIFSSVHLVVLIVLAYCLSFSSASPTREYFLDEQMVEPVVDEDLSPLANRLPGKSQLLVDLSVPPFIPKVWVTSSNQINDGRWPNDSNDDVVANLELVKRKDSPSSSSSSVPTKTTSTSSGSSATAIIVAPTDTSTAIATPFDQGLSNITESCSAFFNNFLSNSTFKSCLPLSLLIQNSFSFFNAAKSVTRISQVLDETCAANVTVCVPLMEALAANISTAENCASDLSASNPLVQQAKLGLAAYEPLYTASCLRNPDTSSYCFADAVTNLSSPTNSYIYYLPVNLTLPSGAQPTCDTCLKNTMAVFEEATGDRSSAIAGDYTAAAQQINVQCGPGYANLTLAAAVSSTNSGTAAAPASIIGIMALVVAVGSWLI